MQINMIERSKFGRLHIWQSSANSPGGGKRKRQYSQWRPGMWSKWSKWHQKLHCHDFVCWPCAKRCRTLRNVRFPFFLRIQCQAHFHSRVCDGALSVHYTYTRKDWSHLLRYDVNGCRRPTPSSHFDSSTCHCRKESRQTSTFRGCVPWGFATGEIVKYLEFGHKQKTQ